MKTSLYATATSAVLLALPLAAQADPFPDADLAAGKDMHTRLCVECHERKYGGEDGSAIYLRPDRRGSQLVPGSEPESRHARLPLRNRIA